MLIQVDKVGTYKKRVFLKTQKNWELHEKVEW